MKKMNKLALALGLALAGSPAFADPVHGVWQTVPDDNGNFGHILVGQCGDTICGQLVRSFDAQGEVFNSPNDGRAIIWDMEAKGGGEYRDGKVYAPDRDRTYNARMQMNGDQLSVSGCVLGICRDGGAWTRVR